ncbi:ABC transporter permease [Streptococcus pneumoniae]|nr:ABC transporter [Streptococcus pneumoniae]VJZ51121.1 ABC transporter permease [Streptococcus pneumoniae]VLR26771.1 ABC transporter permease [Streptococcus pneumoniae]VPG84741.1 ABC transporter permease [Streptococcus pneumoniae]
MKLKLLRVDTKVIMGSFLLVLSSLLALLLPLILKGLIDGSSIENIGSKVFQSFLIFIGQALFSSIGYYLFSQLESFSTFIHHSSLYDVYYLAPFQYQ